MSVTAVAYVRELTKAPSGEAITRSEKLLLYVLADTHNPHKRQAWPSVPRIAEESLMSEREAQRVLRELRRKLVIGFIEPEKSGRGYGRAYWFRAIDPDPALQHTVNHVQCPACRAEKRATDCHPSGNGEGRRDGHPSQGERATDCHPSDEFFSPSERATEGRQISRERMTEGRQNGSRNKEQPGTKYEPGTKSGKAARLSPAERDSWDLRRWREAMERSAPQVGTHGYSAEGEEAERLYRERSRQAAYHAGISIARLQELLRQFFPGDPGIELLAVESKSPVEGSGQ